MSRQVQTWSVRLADAAEQDFRDIYGWTALTFGVAQAETYAAALSSTIDTLRDGPQIPGVKVRNDVAVGLRSVAVKLKRRKGRHHVFFRIAEHAREIVVLRFLHDAMEPTRHLT